MPRHRLFVPHAVSAGEPLELAADQAHYLGRVLRLRPGDALAVFDGSGREFAATITSVGRHNAVLLPGEGAVRDVESPLAIRLIQGVSRGERMDFVVQKATELGVHRISPVITHHSVVRLDGERAGRRLAHWTRIARNACEQCGRTRVPLVDQPAPLAEALADDGAADCRLLLHPGADASLGEGRPAPGGVDLLIGPEGGLSDEERAAASNAGFRPLSLGPRILRTETAALAAVALLQAEWGDLQA